MPPTIQLQLMNPVLRSTPLCAFASHRERRRGV